MEKKQVDGCLACFNNDTKYTPRPNTLSPNGKTPNQYALAAALSLGWSRLRGDRTPVVRQIDAINQCHEVFDRLAKFGHQAINPNYGNEQGAPDPHSMLWQCAFATILREARLQNLPGLRHEAIDYFGDHFSLVRTFWTEAGCRMPCSRAKAPGDMPLSPLWSQDSWAYARIIGADTRKLAKPQSREVLDILLDCKEDFDAIQNAAADAKPKLFVKVRKWETDGGGFVAAVDHDTPMNDPMAWVSVDGQGTIIAAGKSLADFVQPQGEPEVIG